MTKEQIIRRLGGMLHREAFGQHAIGTRCAAFGAPGRSAVTTPRPGALAAHAAAWAGPAQVLAPGKLRADDRQTSDEEQTCKQLLRLAGVPVGAKGLTSG